MCEPGGLCTRGIHGHLKPARELQRRIGAFQQHRPVVLVGAHSLFRLGQALGHAQAERHAAAPSLGLHLCGTLALPHHLLTRFAAVVAASRARLVVVGTAQRHGKSQIRPVRHTGQVHGGAHMPADGARKRVHHQPHLAMAPRIQRGAHGPHQQAQPHGNHQHQHAQHDVVLVAPGAGNGRQRRGVGNGTPHHGKAPGEPHLPALAGADAVVGPCLVGKPWLTAQGLQALRLVCIAAPKAPPPDQHAHPGATKQHHKNHLKTQQTQAQAAVGHRILRARRVHPHRHRHSAALRAFQAPGQVLMEAANVVGQGVDGRPVAVIRHARHFITVVGRHAVGAA